MSFKIKEIPERERPRERLKLVGCSNLTDKELLAIILKTGSKNKNVTDLAIEVLNNYNFNELREITIEELTKIKGIGEVKAIELLATIELGKRIFLKRTKQLKKLSTPKIIWEDSIDKMCKNRTFYGENNENYEK